MYGAIWSIACFRVRQQAIFNLVLWFIFFFPGIIALMISYGYYFAEMSWRFRERSPTSPGGPPLYPFKTVIPIAGFFIGLRRASRKSCAALLPSALAGGLTTFADVPGAALTMISEPVVGIIMMFVMILAIFIGFPIAFTLMALGILFGAPYMGWTVFDLLVQRAYATMSNDVLQAVPLFMLMGYVMERAGIMNRMGHSYHLLVRATPRGHCPDHDDRRDRVRHRQWHRRCGCDDDGRPGLTADAAGQVLD